MLYLMDYSYPTKYTSGIVFDLFLLLQKSRPQLTFFWRKQVFFGSFKSISFYFQFYCKALSLWIMLCVEIGHHLWLLLLLHTNIWNGCCYCLFWYISSILKIIACLQCCDYTYMYSLLINEVAKLRPLKRKKSFTTSGKRLAVFSIT